MFDDYLPLGEDNAPEYITLERINVLKEMQLIEFQNELLASIDYQLSQPKNFNHMSDVTAENSEPSGEFRYGGEFGQGGDYPKEYDGMTTSVLSQLLNQGNKKVLSLDQALYEVKINCSEAAFQNIRRAIERSKTRPHAYYQKLIEKQKNRYFELFNKYFILSKQNESLRKTVSSHESDLKKFRDDNKTLRRASGDFRMEKQQQWLKAKQKLLYQELLVQEKKNKLGNQEKVLMKEKQILVNLEKDVVNVLHSLGDVVCQGKCWKADLFESCQTEMQRKKEVLEENQRLVDGYYDRLQKMCRNVYIEIDS